MKKIFSILSQYFTWLAFRIYFLISFSKIDYSGFKLKHGRKYILVANHITRWDALLVPTALPISYFSKLIPFSCIAEKKYMKLFPINFFLKYSYNCFSNDITGNKGRKPLEVAKLYLKKYTLVIFPEKRINSKMNKNLSLGIGVIILERDNLNCYLVPVKLEKISFFRFKITFKEPFRHSKFTNDLYPLIKDTMGRVYE